MTLILGALLYMYYSEIYESHFENYEQLANSELIQKGWVARFIPKSSYEIYETHAVDTDRVKVIFKFTPGDTKEIEQSCDLFENTHEMKKYTCKYGTSTILVILEKNGKGEILSK